MQRDLLALWLSDLAHVEDAITIRSILGAVALAKGATFQEGPPRPQPNSRRS